MLRSCRKYVCKIKPFTALFIQNKSFLTNDYKCNEAWNLQTASPLFDKINLNDFYNVIDQSFATKGVISAIDVDIFANAIKDPFHLDELKDLLHKLRLSAETGNMLQSTSHATVRQYLQFGSVDELINILKDPLNFGVFLDEYVANILIDKLVTTSNFEQAANVASLIMLQEEYSNEITNALCQYACFKYVKDFINPPVAEIIETKKKKIEEIKIRVKFLRNPYFDDHFDIKDLYTLSGKTLAWISERSSENTNINLQIIGWVVYKKYEKLLKVCQENAKQTSFKIYHEVIDVINKEINYVDEDGKEILELCVSILSKVCTAEVPLEESIKILIENAINKKQNKDIQNQQKVFQLWSKERELKLEEQTKRLDRAKRIEEINEQQRNLQTNEQQLWFFENEDTLDLEIEDKERSMDSISKNKSTTKIIDEDYIPPEILPKRR